MSLQSSFITTALIGSLVFIGGCSTFDSTWKSTKAFYGEYINPPAQIDYDDKGVLNDAETTLASRMVGIYIQLEQLERYLQNSDKPRRVNPWRSFSIISRGFPASRRWTPMAWSSRRSPGGHERA
ncbi:MAG: hypothetical protein ACLT2T_05475 [Bilophila wadsworthia]